MERTFLSPPVTHGPVPFYWWAGEALDRGRIAWQLDQLCEKGVRQTIVSYPHHSDGTNDPGDPKLFSPAWWDLFRWFLGECRQRGMTAGFQDYTLGGWWEWAPPDFHFRQPYWQHAQSLNGFFTRLSWILSQGVRRCDVAIVYPIAALDAEPADPALIGIVAHIGNEALGGVEPANPQPEDSAFHLGKHLFDRNCDFDFLDCESLERATPADGRLHVAGGAYRVLLLPAMAAVRISTVEKARAYVRAGGVVIAYGCLPKASDRAGRHDPVLDALIAEIFGSTAEDADLEKSHPGGGKAFFIRLGREKVMEEIDVSIERDVVSIVPLHVLHRHLEDKEVIYLFNPAEHPVETTVTLRDVGRAELWNAWTGEILDVALDRPLSFAARESKLLVIHRGENSSISDATASCETTVLETLDGPWKF